MVFKSNCKIEPPQGSFSANRLYHGPARTTVRGTKQDSRSLDVIGKLIEELGIAKDLYHYGMLVVYMGQPCVDKLAIGRDISGSLVAISCY